MTKSTTIDMGSAPMNCKRQSVSNNPTLVETFKRIMAECYECRDLPIQFASEKSMFRLGWGDHTAGCGKPIGTNLHRQRGLNDRGNVTKAYPPYMVDHVTRKE